MLADKCTCKISRFIVYRHKIKWFNWGAVWKGFSQNGLTSEAKKTGFIRLLVNFSLGSQNGFMLQCHNFCKTGEVKVGINPPKETLIVFSGQLVYSLSKAVKWQWHLTQHIENGYIIWPKSRLYVWGWCSSWSWLFSSDLQARLTLDLQITIQVGICPQVHSLFMSSLISIKVSFP